MKPTHPERSATCPGCHDRHRWSHVESTGGYHVFHLKCPQYGRVKRDVLRDREVR